MKYTNSSIGIWISNNYNDDNNGPLITSSDPQATQSLAKGDVVKIQLGAHIDGFAAISAETIVVGASAADPVTGRQADVIKAAWTAAEVAMRLVKVGHKNWAVTEGVAKTVQTWGCKPVEGTSISFCSFFGIDVLIV